jgi:alginate O-acetyltransferase complex protein AlgI
MLFSSPDYPLFLIAVFFLYALARWSGGRQGAWARLAVMVLLADVVFMLVAKDPDTLWDPIGGLLLRVASSSEHVLWGITDALRTLPFVDASTLPKHPPPMEWPWLWLCLHWMFGGALLGLAIQIGKLYGEWIASERGQRLIAIGFVGVLAAIGVTVIVASRAASLDPVTDELVAHGHLLVLAVLGVGLGASYGDPTRPLGRVIVLFVASALFYHAWASEMPGPYRYLLALLLGTIVLDYYLGLWIERTEDPWARRALVIVSLCSNLGILVFFKYSDFFRLDVLQLDGDRWNLILPAGISFHTFQSLSYTIDVYRRELKATKSVVEFATFVLFFPQLVAGPIVRAQDLLPQLAKPPPLELRAAQAGLFRICIGLFKKIALADALALAIVDRVFEAPERFSSLEVLVGIYAYALQIYLDFSAYSDIAIGSAQILGFELPENFRTPYRSANLQEFWRRWHISLSTWLRDYLYITLGGSKGAQWRTYVNLSLTMVIGGLWHGASWAFIVWGALHGFGLAITRFFQRRTAETQTSALQTLGICAAISAGGMIYMTALDLPGVWAQLAAAWLFLTPLWAVLTAWLGREEPPTETAAPVEAEGMPWRPLWTHAPAIDETGGSGNWRLAEALRLAMCVAGVLVFVAFQWGERWTWIPSIVMVWLLGFAADVAERGRDTRGRRRGFSIAALIVALSLFARAFVRTMYVAPSWAWIPLVFFAWIIGHAAQTTSLVDFKRRLLATLRRTLAVVLVFHYVCLAWIFFRASSFDNALAVLRQLGKFETDSANVGPLVSTALAVGFLAHFFADGSFRWLRDRFVSLHPIFQGAVLAAVALVLRELAQTKIVPFIYFQF